jgi:hypothetical protein
MSLSRPGRMPVPSLKIGAHAVVVLVALASAGCSGQTRTAQPNWMAGPQPQPQAHVATEASRRPDLEDDGMEAQVPPHPSIRMAPDAPNEPFSPNYGTRNGPPPDSAPAKPASQPQPATPPRNPTRPRFAGTVAD